MAETGLSKKHPNPSQPHRRIGPKLHGISTPYPASKHHLHRIIRRPKMPKSIPKIDPDQERRNHQPSTTGRSEGDPCQINIVGIWV